MCKRGIKIRIEIKPFYAVIIVLSILAVFILRPFISTIIAGIVFAYLSNPLYKFLLKKLNSSTIAALITTFVVILIISLPTIFALNALSKEIFAGYIMAKQYLATGAQTISCTSGFPCNLLKLLGLSEPSVLGFISDTLGKVSASMFSSLTQYVISLPRIIANLFVALFLSYYLLKDGSKVIEYVKPIIPLKVSDLNMLMKRFNDVTYAVVYGNVIVAIIQGILTSVGFFIFGVTSPLIWGIVTIFTSLLPFLGAAVVWLPASVFLMVSGYSSGDSATLLRGIGLFLFGLMVISGIDNILKPRLIGGRANLHPAIVLLGVIGGLYALGVIGLIIGPVIMALAATIITIASRQKMGAK